MKFKEATASESAKDFVRLKDGESVKGVLRGEPYEFRTHWIGQRTELCTGPECVNCKAGSKSSFRFRVNFIVRGEDGKFTPRIFEQGWKMYKDLNGLNTEYDLERTVIKITRHGAGKNDTTYAVVPLPNGQVTDAMLNEIAPLKLLDLAKVETAAVTEENHDSSEVPF